MERVSHISGRAASLRVERATYHLNSAGQQLAAATHAAPDRYHQQRLRRLLADLRGLSQPLSGIALSLARGGRQ
jgi:hypothetical protein